MQPRRDLRAPDGRAVIDELPRRFGLVAGEVDLAHQYLARLVDELIQDCRHESTTDEENKMQDLQEPAGKELWA